jgi:glycosyltransferase involved in cell wall biosynthesis
MRSDLKIALIYLGRRGGGAVYALEVARALHKKAKCLVIISQQVWNLKVWRDSGLPLLEIPTYQNPLSFVFSTLNIVNHLTLRNKLSNFDPDVLYYPMLDLWTPLVNWLMPRVPKVLTLHDPVQHYGERNLILAIVQWLAIRQSSRFILLSRSFIEKGKRLGISSDCIDVIPHGEFSYYTRFRKVDSKGPKSTILFFGRILPYKGLNILLDAFPLIKERIPEARLFIIGSGNLKPYKERLQNLHDVIFVNRWIADDEVATFFQQADILVAPYIDASQSGVIPIAYAFKVPVIATRVGGLSEQVEDGKTGLLVNAGDATALAEACVCLLSNPSWATSLGEAGYQKAIREWNWDWIAEIVYESCAKAVFARHKSHP